MARIWIGLALVLAVLAGGVRADALPELSATQSRTWVTPEEKALGAAWLRRLRGQVSTVDDPWLTEYLLDLIYRLYPQTGMDDGEISLVVVDSPELNAFAVPGGVVGVNGGLLLHTQREDELAAVLAHELAHLSQRHFARRQDEAGKQTAISLAGLLASVVVAAAAGSDAGFAAMATTQAYTLQSQLAYSRENETEADNVGMSILARSGFSPLAMTDMFQRMIEASRYQGRAPEYLMTHPLSESRLAQAQARVRQVSGSFARSSGMAFYLVQARLKVRYAKRPEDALASFEAQLKAPELGSKEAGMQRLAALYGAALAAMTAGQDEKAGERIRMLADELGAEPMVQALQASWLARNGQPDQALHLLRRALELRPGRYALLRIYARIAAEAGELSSAITTLRELARDYPDEPAIWSELADLYGKSGALAQVHMARAEALQLKGDVQGAIRELREARKKAAGDYIAATRIVERLKTFEAWQRNPVF